MTDEQKQTLIDDIANYIDFTWYDYGITKKVREWTESGMTFLQARAGKKLDFMNNSDGSRNLLMKYVLYAFNGNDNFIENYREELMNLTVSTAKEESENETNETS